MSRRALSLFLALLLLCGGLYSAWAQAAMLGSGAVSIPSDSQDAAVPMLDRAVPELPEHCRAMAKQTQDAKRPQADATRERPANKPATHACHDQPCQCDELGCHVSVSLPAQAAQFSLLPRSAAPLQNETAYISLPISPEKRPPIHRS